MNNKNWRRRAWKALVAHAMTAHGPAWHGHHPDVVAIKAAHAALADDRVPAGFALRHARAAALEAERRVNRAAWRAAGREEPGEPMRPFEAAARHARSMLAYWRAQWPDAGYCLADQAEYEIEERGIDRAPLWARVVMRRRYPALPLMAA